MGGGGSKDSTPRRLCWDPVSPCEIAAPSTVDWLSVACVSLPSPGVPGRCKQALGVLVFPLSGSGQGRTAGTPAPGVCLVAIKHWAEACLVHGNS